MEDYQATVDSPTLLFRVFHFDRCGFFLTQFPYNLLQYLFIAGKRLYDTTLFVVVFENICTFRLQVQGNNPDFSVTKSGFLVDY